MKTNKLKELQGTLKTARVKNVTSQPIENKNLLGLSETEEEIVQLMKSHLEEADASQKVDIMTINLTARLLTVLNKAAENVLANNGVMTFPNGTKQVSPEWSIFKQGMEMYNDMSDRLGLDPKSRLKLEYFSRLDKKDEDPIMKLIKND
jgi:P27 family predicted phage terminase small subunit